MEVLGNSLVGTHGSIEFIVTLKKLRSNFDHKLGAKGKI